MRRDMDGTTRFVEENRHPFEAMRILRDHDDSVQSLIPYFQASGAFAWNMEGVCVCSISTALIHVPVPKFFMIK